MPRRRTDLLYKRKDSPYYWTWVYEGGRRVRKSTQCTDRKAALSVAATMQREAADPRQRHAGETVADALLAYCEAPTERSENTAKNYYKRSVVLSEKLGHIRLADLCRDDIERYVIERKKKHRTIRHELVTLRAALKLAKQRGRVVPDLDLLAVSIPGKVEPKERWLTRAEFAELMKRLSPHRADWVRVAVYTGARLEEVNGLRWDDVDLDAGIMHIRGKKTDGSDRVIPIAAPLLDWMTAADRSGGVVVRRLTNRDCLKTAARRAKIAPVTPHDFRRTFASWLLQDGVSERDIADLIGHRHTGLVRTVYAKTSLDRMRSVIGHLC